MTITQSASRRKTRRQIRESVQPPAAGPFGKPVAKVTSHGHGDSAKLSRMDIAQLQAALAIYFAPWVQALGLIVEQADGQGVRVRLPLQPPLAREGGMVCGQAMMAAADTCMVLALMQHWGAFKPCTTVQMSTSFLKPLAGQDGVIESRLIRVGKSLAFGEIDIRGANDGRSVCRATTTYALL